MQPLLKRMREGHTLFGAIDFHAFGHALDVVAGLVEGDQFDPIEYSPQKEETNVQ